MKGLGRREVVGLGALGVALVLAFIFLDPAASESRQTLPGQISLGETPTPTPVVTPTATPTPPPTALGPPPGGWIVGFHQDALSGGSILVAQTATNTLDFAYKSAPFPDVKDDAWAMRAEGSFQLAAGRYLLKLEHEGGLIVTVNDKQVFSEEATNGPRTAAVEFVASGGSAQIRIEARDVKGPFRLKALE